MGFEPKTPDVPRGFYHNIYPLFGRGAQIAGEVKPLDKVLVRVRGVLVRDETIEVVRDVLEVWKHESGGLITVVRLYAPRS